MSSVGTRVGAIYESNVVEKVIKIFGYGTYLGDSFPHEKAKLASPKILLDSGEVIYGYQCWWGEEHKVREQLQSYLFKGFKIIEIKPSDAFNLHEVMYY